MIKCETIKEFTLKKFDELQNIKRISKNQVGKLFVGDTFECSKEMADYLTGNNQNGEVVVKIIEIVPEIKLTHDDKIEERVIPLNTKEELEKLGEELKKYVVTEPKKSKKAKSSKK